MKDVANKVFNLILAELKDRSGFDHWWYSIDEDIQFEIRDTIKGIIQEEMDKFLKRQDEVMLARSLRLAVIQNQFDQGNLTEEEARELLSGELTPGDDTSKYDDSSQLESKR